MGDERLAVDGGQPAIRRPAERFLIGREERDAVVALMDCAIAEGKAFDRYDGMQVEAYESEFARWLGLKYATAVSSGTAAVHSALAALRLEPGSEVVCSPITDPGAVMPVVWNQCIPVFADSAGDSFNVTAETVAAALSDRTAAVAVGHIAGEPCPIEAIAALAKRRGLPLIEDCAQAHGATYRGRPVGTFGTLATFSMMSGKHHTSGGQGGMVLTDDQALYWDAKRFADRGKPFHSQEGTNLLLGLNYRMTELEAAIGRIQLRRLPAIVRRRQELAARLAQLLRRTQAFSMGAVPEGAASACWFLRIKVNLKRLVVDKEQAAKALSAEGASAAATYTTLIYRQTWFAERRTFGRSQLPWSLPGARKVQYDGACPNAERALLEHLVCSFHECMDEEYIDALGRAFEKVDRAYRVSPP